MLLLIDAHNLMHRMWHAHKGLCASDGFPTGIVYGFYLKLTQLIERFKPSHLVVAADTHLPPGQTKFRCTIDPTYKGDRKPPEPDFLRQVPLCEAVTLALGGHWLESGAFEADDVLVTLAERTAHPHEVVLVSSDKDLLHLTAMAHVRVLRPDSDHPIGRAEVEAEYGFHPLLLPTYLALVGDACDHVPGVKGIGPVAARALIRAFGELAAIYEGMLAKDGPSRLRAACPDVRAAHAERWQRLLAAGREQAARMLQLVRAYEVLGLPPLAALRCQVMPRAALFEVLGDLQIQVQPTGALRTPPLPGLA